MERILRQKKTDWNFQVMEKRHKIFRHMGRFIHSAWIFDLYRSRKRQLIQNEINSLCIIKITTCYFTFLVYKLTTAIQYQIFNSHCLLRDKFFFLSLFHITCTSQHTFRYWNFKFIYALTMTIVLSNIASRACQEKIRYIFYFLQCFAC